MKKKLIWKFNIVDIVVIAVILALAAFFAGKFLKSAQSAGNAQQGTITFQVEVAGMTKALYDEVAPLVPCQMAASGEWVSGYIREVSYTPCQVEYLEIYSPVNASEKQYLKADPETEYVNAVFTCEGQVNLNDMFNMLGNQEIRLGRSYYLKGVDVELYGTIRTLEKSAG